MRGRAGNLPGYPRGLVPLVDSSSLGMQVPRGTIHFEPLDALKVTVDKFHVQENCS